MRLTLHILQDILHGLVLVLDDDRPPSSFGFDFFSFPRAIVEDAGAHHLMTNRQIPNTPIVNSRVGRDRQEKCGKIV